MANTTGKKFGGRQKVTPNRMTKELRGVPKNLLQQELERIDEHLEQLDSKERIDVLIKLIPFVFESKRGVL